MSRVWNFLTKPIFELPRWLPFYALIFLVTAYVGFRLSLLACTYYEDSRQFSSLPKNEARGLQNEIRSLNWLDESAVLTPAEEVSLLAQIDGTERTRRTAPTELLPVFDLQQAMNYLCLAALEKQKGAAAAQGHLLAAREILKSLGWQDVSDETLLRVAAEDGTRRVASGRK